ncbi:hypothetical protein B5M09_011496 [Aphanomyces astaci]|uniref:Calcium-activated potassium channel BK alpha subunit domain-containing protein n=1 Tax=Aphanomyces astaci TaxID=112090 RepID=A0A3R7Y6B2_APHAT|nr:hypothetical protein B5M09_011496 [Aphanomyces astaci]
MQEADLKRAAVPTSAICYVLTSCAGDRSGRADQMSAILTTAFRVMNKTVPIFTQVIASTSVSYCTISGATNVVCVQKLKMSMLALSCGIKGLTTLLTNLLSTLSPPSKPAKEPWMAEYLQGAMSKIFRVDIPRSFSGITYHELVMFLYNNLQVIPIAMEMVYQIYGNGIQLNPMSFKLGQAADPKLCCTVYVIAPNLQVIDRINEYQHEQIREFRQTLRKMERAKADAEGAENKSPKSAKKQKKKFTLGGHVFRSNSHDTAGFDIKAAYDLFMAKDLPTVLDGHIVVVGLPFALQDLLDPLHTKSSSQSKADSGTTNATVEFFDKNMVDADAITCVRFILEGCSRHRQVPPNLIVDLAKHTNVRFLSMAVKRESRRERRLTDRMLLQGGHLTMDDATLADMDIGGDDDENEDVLDMNYIYEPAYASGRTRTNQKREIMGGYGAS